MINVPQEIITAYLTDSTNKSLEIDHNADIRDINRYYGMSKPNVYRAYYSPNLATYSWLSVYAAPSNDDFTDSIRITPGRWSYINISFEYYAKTDATYQLSGHWQIIYTDTNNIDKIINLGNGVLSTNKTVFPKLSISNPSDLVSIRYIRFIVDGDTPSTTLMIFNGSVAVKQTASSTFTAFKLSPDFNKYQIDSDSWWVRNDALLYEDFTLTESLCSQDNIKFGLCESAHCEFGLIGLDQIKVGDEFSVKTKYIPLDIQDIPDSAIREINWAMWQPTEQTSRTHTETLYHVMPLYQYTEGFYYWNDSFVGAFDLSPYYDQYFDGRYIGTALETQITINSYTASERPAYIKLFFYYLGMDGNRYSHTSDYLSLADFESDFVRVTDYTPATPRQIRGFMGVAVGFYKSDYSLYTTSDEITATFDVRRVQYHSLLQNETIPDYDNNAYYLYKEVHNLPQNLTDYIEACKGIGSVPLGRFKVDGISNKYRHNIVEHQITAYDNLLTLEDNAADWYTRYMFGVDTDGWVSNGFEFARQIFSSYWNYATSTNLDSRSNYTETEIASYDYFADIKPSHLSNKYLSWTTSDPVTKLRYAELSVTPDPSKLYMVSFVNSGGGTDEETINLLPSDYFEQVDSLGRGVATNGSILVWETRSDGTTAGFCVNKNDYFMISPECTALKIYVVAQSCYSDSTPAFRFLDSLSIYTVETKPELTNGHLRLCYYNYGTKEIFKCESSITGRDVVRSLLEVCGCFFRLDRYNGLPEFVYPTKGGLYPSNTLYPADDLYPRAGTDQLYSMGKYISVIAENYEVKNYGRIQILKKIKSSDTQSVVEWQYEGDPDSENTYIIDDNIFYCAEEMEYDYDGMPEVADMLEGMWLVISNLGYVPNTTQALGAPWLECGDRVGLLTYDGGFETFVFRRTLKGIQNLRDTYESEGNELTPAISNFGYSV